MNQKMNEYTLVVADDHPMFLQGITSSLVASSVSISTLDVTSYVKLFELLEKREADVDLILMDLNMPGSNSESGIYYIRKLYPEIPLVVLSAHDTIDVKLKCLSLGASEFLSKSTDVDKLVDCIHAILNGEYQFPSQPKAHINTESTNKVSSLTPSQFKVLHLIADGHANKTIADILNISEKTVKNHISVIFNKLEVTNRTQAGNIFNSVDEPYT